MTTYRGKVLAWLSAMIVVSIDAPAVSNPPCVPSPLFSGNVMLPAETSGGNWKTESIVAGLFDGDNSLDVILGDTYRKLVFYRGRGDWWDFDPPVLIPLPFTYGAIPALVSGDFNEDGHLDLAIATSGAGLAQRIRVMRGNGNGTFQAPTAYGPSVNGVQRLAVADFNGDDNLDLTYGSVNNSVGILWGAGNGTFATSTVISSDASIGDVSDIDNDGDVDIVSAGAQRILRNNGNSTFLTETLPPVNPELVQLWSSLGELNGDGWPDLVFATLSCCGCPAVGKVYVRLNDGAGIFLPPAEYPISTNPCQLGIASAPIAADLDGDGRAEVIVGRRTECSATMFNEQVLVFRNVGTGALQPQPDIFHCAGSHYADPSRLVASDFNNDGRTDVIASMSSFTTLLLNDGAGSFLTAHGTPLGEEISSVECGQSALTNFRDVCRGDMNGDGRFDLVAVRENTSNPPLLECTVMLQDAQGAFTNVFSTPLVEPFTTGLALDDFDGDQNLDVVVSTSSQSAPNSGNLVRVAMGNGNGTFDAWIDVACAGYEPRSVSVGDLNGDQWPDLIVTMRWGPNYPTEPQGPRGLSVHLNNGNGTFAPAVGYDIGNITECAGIGDVNGDGHADVVVGWGFAWAPGGGHGISVLLNDGSGQFSVPPTTVPYPFPTGTSQIVLKDVNADASLDLIFSPGWHSEEPVSGGIVVALNNGNGTFQQAYHASVGLPVYDLAVVDLNDDEHDDLIAGEISGAINGGRIHIHLGNGDGTFGPLVSYSGGWKWLIVEDFNNDGRPDIGTPLGCSHNGDLATHVGFSILYNRMCRRGDVDCDDATDESDVALFVEALLTPEIFSGCVLEHADLNLDGLEDGGDIALFTEQLLNPPTTPIGACCKPDMTCTDGVTAYECAVMAGVFHGANTTCAGVTCPVGACCLPETGSCSTIAGVYYCEGVGGTYQGDGTSCQTASCPGGRYQNLVSPIQYFVPGGQALYLIDDMTLAGTGARELESFNLLVYGGNSGGGPFDVLVDLSDNCFGNPIDGALFLFEDVPDDGFAYVLSVDPVDPGIILPDTVWMGAFFSTEESGWIIANEAEIGSTEDRIFSDTKFQCDTTLPCCYAGLWANLTCVEGSGQVVSAGNTKAAPASAAEQFVERNGKRYRVGRVSKLEGAAAPVAVERQP